MLMTGHAWAVGASGDEKAPSGVRLEAEANRASDSATAEDGKASGGKAVSNSKAWQPLMAFDVPADLTTTVKVTVYIRHRGGPIQLKTTVEGKVVERNWVWAKPEEWTWSKVGTYDRSELGTKLTLMRGSGNAVVWLDAVVLSPSMETADAAGATAPQAAGGGGGANGGPVLPPDVQSTGKTGRLPPDRPDPAKPMTQAAASVEWGRQVAKAPTDLFGVGDYEVHDPKSAADTAFHSFMVQVNPPLIRIHRGSLPKAWLNAEGTGWNAAAIRECFEAIRPAYRDTPLMLNMSSFPKPWTDSDGILKPEHEHDFHRLAVELMRIMRDEVRRPVAYWEVLNEKDGGPMKAGRYDDVLRIYIGTIKAMKAFDPAAKVGGFAFTWANPAWIKPFISAGALDVSDFITYHNYGIGEVTDSNEKLMGTLNSVSRNAQTIRRMVDEAAPGRRVPIFLDEYNVKWVWTPIEPRHGNAVGSAFHAALLRRVALAGIDGANVWHVKGGAYGILNADNTPRLTAPLFEWGAKYLVGDIPAHSEATDELELFPVVRADGKRSLLLINKADHSLSLPPIAELMPGAGQLQQLRVEHMGRSEGEVDTGARSERLQLPGFSLTLLVER